jgi:hypothetical protein
MIKKTFSAFKTLFYLMVASTELMMASAEQLATPKWLDAKLATNIVL